jgi:molybdopterin-guanine dinucleotide biosynthesis protein A
MIDIPCIIFAGGKSSRMGEDKSLLPFAGAPTLTQYQYNRLSQIFTKVYISCKNPDKFDFEAHFIKDPLQQDLFAPTLGFIAAFEQLQAERIFVLSVDTPFVSEQEIDSLLAADTAEYDATIARTNEGIQTLCGIYHACMKPAFEKMLQDNRHKLGLLLKHSHTKYVHFSQTQPFLNCNHPHEYQEALKIIRNY